MDQILTGTDAGETILVSSDESGAPGDGDSRFPILSPDGTKVVFESLADNLVPGDTDHRLDVFVKDLTTGDITRVSVDAAGHQGAGLYAADARFSPDGSKVVFASSFDNLVPGDTNATLGSSDVFVKDLKTGAITLVSTDSSGAQGDGRYGEASFLPDGSKVVFSGPVFHPTHQYGEAVGEVFIKDLNTGITIQVSTQGSVSPMVSPDGTKIAYVTGDPRSSLPLSVTDLISGVTTEASFANPTGAPLYANGTVDPAYVGWLDSERVLFQHIVGPGPSLFSNVQSEIYVQDLTTGAVTLVSANAAGDEGSGYSRNAAGFSNGTKVAFDSDSSDLVSGDVDLRSDVFVKDLVTGDITLVSTGLLGAQDDLGAYLGSVMPDGSRVAFYALDWGASHSSSQVYVNILGSGEDSLSGGAGNDTIYGKGGDDLLDGAAGGDWIDGGSGNDTIRGQAGDDSLFGQSGSDYIEGGDGNDVIDGGAGFNVAAYTTANHFVVVDLAVQGVWQDTQGAGNDLITNVENVVGSDFNDTLSGDGQTTVIYGGNGDDTLYGRAGDDNLFGQAGADYIEGGDGNDVIDGGTGFNVASYASASSFVVVDLALQGVWQDTQGAGADLITNVENLIGSDFNDNLTGDGHTNVIYGGNGDDTLYGKGGDDNLFGGNGNDYIDGGPGADILSGDSGADAFVFGASFGHDTVTDFTATGAGHDRILLLSSMFADFAAVQSHLTQSGSDVVISDGLGDTLTLSNLLTTDLSAGDFTFV